MSEKKGWTDSGWMGGWVDGWMDGWMGGHTLPKISTITKPTRWLQMELLSNKN